MRELLDKFMLDWIEVILDKYIDRGVKRNIKKIKITFHYQLYKGSHVLTVRKAYLLKHINHKIEEIIDEISWVASHLQCEVIEQSRRIIIKGNEDYDVMSVLLTYFELQLLIYL